MRREIGSLENSIQLELGCLLFDDEIFCGQIVKVLQTHCNRPIAEIGSLDVSYTL